MSLSASQQAAVQCDAARPLQILAGPGSGKTRVLTMRVAHLLLDAERDARVLPQHCVVVTFTNKAANEMRTRLTELIGPERTQKLVLGTFHALCAMFLRRHGARIGIDHNFTIADTDALIKRVYDAMLERLLRFGSDGDAATSSALSEPESGKNTHGLAGLVARL